MTTTRSTAAALERPPLARRPLLCPFDLQVEPLARMLNFEIVDDPTYDSLEIQALDDELHGTGLAVLLGRRADRRVDIYRQPGLRLEPSNYGIGGGLGRWLEAEIAPARLDIARDGVAVDVALHDADGRRVEVRLDDRDGHVRRRAMLLAPMSAAIEQPTSMLLVWMDRFDLVRTSGPAPELRIDGRRVATGTLPGAWLHHRRLIKSAAGLAAVRLNAAYDGPLRLIDPAESGDVLIEDSGGRQGIAGMARSVGGHSARLELDPPLPDIARLADRESVAGTWRLAIDREPVVVAGTWSARRVDDRVELGLDVTRGWHPRGLPLLMRIVTRFVPTFRAWPLTYRWRATIGLGDGPTMTSRWERTTGVRDESYRKLTGSAVD